jgi:hypothetical protein
MKKIIIVPLLLLVAIALAAAIYFQTRPTKSLPVPENNFEKIGDEKNATGTISQTEKTATATTTNSSIKVKTKGSGNAQIVVSAPAATTTGNIETCVAATGESINMIEAQQIFDASQCSREGSAKPEHSCNKTTGTLWIDIMAYRKGCEAICVIDIATKEAKVEWICETPNNK